MTPSNWLEQTLNARSEKERRDLFAWDLNRKGGSIPDIEWNHPWYPVPDNWGGKGQVETDGSRLASLKDIFDFFCERLDVLQDVAATLADGQAPSPALMDRVDDVLSEVRLSLKVGRGKALVKKGTNPFYDPSQEAVLTKTAVEMWRIFNEEADYTLKRCKRCKRIIVDRSRGRKRETCSSSCRTLEWYDDPCFPERKEKRKKKSGKANVDKKRGVNC